MNSGSDQQLEEFVNALQLSIDSRITASRRLAPDTLLLTFIRSDPDSSLDLFIRLMDTAWEGNNDSFLTLKNISEPHLSLVTQFLMLTRLNRENMEKIAVLDHRFRELVSRLNLSPERSREISNLETLSQTIQIIFQQVEKKGMTLREISDKTGLSMVAISNFKAGNDIRLSNFLKLAKATGFQMSLKPLS